MANQQAAYFALGDLSTPLSEETVPGRVPARMADRVPHREAEFQLPVAPHVHFESDSWHSQPSVSRSTVSRARYLYGSRTRVVNNRRRTHVQGELSHYFDRIWVLSGSLDERFV